MTTLSELFSMAQRIKLELQDGLERLEKLESSATMGSGSGLLLMDEPIAPDLTERMRTKLAELRRLTTEMDHLYKMQMGRANSNLWKRKVEALFEEGAALHGGLDKYLVREQRRQREASDRMELLGRRNQAREGAQVLSEFEADQRDMETAKNSSRMLEETLQSGFATLKKMAEQREILKGAQRRALDVLNYVGLSDAVLKKINRKLWWDRLITYGGMVFTLGVVFVVWRWTR
eukprot:TRINITY_DN35930_c0_g1_i1.p1 TRINITY_DN35930_c0_g1~~TRINITY_DN35930_c0_g1_i1.p1  ORF type:complete len:233 (-),score=38.95 TRINITY_DN35930_c0_g1_i1:1070-1768(-)